MNELLILSRAIHFGSCLVLLAVFGVRLMVERPVGEDGRARGLAGVCLAAAMGSGVLWLWVSAAVMSGSSLGQALDIRLLEVAIGETAPGHVWMVRGGLGVVLGVALCFRGGGWNWKVGAGIAGAFVGSLAWLGHAGAGEDGRRAAMLGVDGAHLVAASLWPGGLLPFGLLLRRLMKEGRLGEACAAARRFSMMSLVTVGVLAASGLGNALFLVGSFEALVGTDYGRLLMAKVGLFLIAVTLGAWNLLVYKPHLETAPHALGAMVRKVWMELALGTLIVIVVAILGTLPPG